jgi:hypothetical protein
MTEHRSVVYPTFHAKDGFNFERTEDGGVKIMIAKGKELVYGTYLDANTWASVMGAVSMSGDTAIAHALALEYHNTNLADYEKKDEQPVTIESLAKS